MSGETQRQRNMEQDLRKIKAKLGENVGETITIILHDFNDSNHPFPPPDVITEDGIRIQIRSTPLTADDMAEYEEKVKKNDP